MKYISTMVLPIAVVGIIIYGLRQREKVFDVFLNGAKQGIEVSIRIIPSIIGIMVAIGVFKASGALDIFTKILNPVTSSLGIPSEVTSLALMRPISGSASLGIVSQTVNEYGPDSKIGKIASAIMGCTETTFYTVAIYFGSVGIKNIRYVLPIALLADLLAVIVVCNIIR